MKVALGLLRVALWSLAVSTVKLPEDPQHCSLAAGVTPGQLQRPQSSLPWCLGDTAVPAHTRPARKVSALFSSSYIPAHRTSYIICADQCKMKTGGPVQNAEGKALKGLKYEALSFLLWSPSLAARAFFICHVKSCCLVCVCVGGAGIVRVNAGPSESCSLHYAHAQFSGCHVPIQPITEQMPLRTWTRELAFPWASCFSQ